MKFTTDSKTFARALTTVSRAASKRGTVQVLGGLQLKAKGNEVTITATDMDLTISLVIAANVTQQDEAIVPAVALKAAIKDLKGEITCATEADVFTITQGHRTMRVSLYEITDYPKLPDEAYPTLPKGSPDAVTIATTDFLAAWQTVALSYSRDESRPVLTGVLFEAKDDVATLVTTDSYRLAVDTLPATIPSEESWIVPGRTLMEAVRLLKAKGGPETFQIKAVDQRIVITVGTTVILGRKIDGQFPNYKQLLPDGFPQTVTLNREQFLDAANAAAAAAVRNTPVRMTVTQNDVTLRVSVENVDVVEIPLEAEIYLDERDYKDGFTIGWAADFLSDIPATLTGDKITIKLISPLRPSVFVTEERPNALHLLMPIRLAG